MTRNFILTAAAASLFALPAFAETPAPGAAPMPEASTPAPPAAATGTAANTAASAADLKTGAKVMDSAGAEVGLVTQVNPGKAGAGATVTLSAEGKTIEVPVSSITKTDGGLVSSRTKAQVWAGAHH